MGNEEVVRKMLLSLPKSWEANVTAIKEVKNLEMLTLDELISSLFTHEMRLNEGLKAHVATWSDEDSSDNEDQEIANLFLMAIDDPKVTSNSSISSSYSFDKLQNVYDELGLENCTFTSISKLHDFQPRRKHVGVAVKLLVPLPEIATM
ncbi:hypothetical protein Gotur_020100 [Gossypium turneri]